MSRSYKKHKIFKSGGWFPKKLAKRLIRRRQREAIRLGKEIPDPKTLINPYDVIDQVFIATTKEEEEKYKQLWRK